MKANEKQRRKIGEKIEQKRRKMKSIERKIE